MSSKSTSTVQLSAHHSSTTDVPRFTTNCSPRAIMQDLNSPKAVIQIIDQSDVETLCKTNVLPHVNIHWSILMILRV